MHVRAKRNFTLGAVALAALVMACSNETANQAALAVVTAGEADAQTTNTTPQTKAPAGPAKALPAGALEVTLVGIQDNQGFDRPMTAAKILIPKGWTTQGGVVWNKGACGDLASFDWATSSPDGLTRVELLPVEAWGASNSTQSPCQYGEFQDMQSYLAAYIQRRYPGARIGQYTSRPDFLDLQKDVLQAKIAMVNSSGTGLRAWGDAGEMTYTARSNGAEIEGVVGGAAAFVFGQAYNPFGAPLMSLNGQTNGMFAASGPKGKFDRKMADAIRKSVKLEQDWAEKYLDAVLKVSNIQTQGVKDRAAIIVAAGAAMTANTVARNKAAGERAVRNSYADPSPSASSSSRNDTEDRMQRERIEGVRGVETYDDPVYGGTVQLDNTYDNAWRVNNADSYILTNDPNFNPGLYNIDAQQLKVTR